MFQWKLDIASSLQITDGGGGGGGFSCKCWISVLDKFSRDFVIRKLVDKTCMYMLLCDVLVRFPANKKYCTTNANE